ncbi:right-handed parallel beta-helix repeat-containing protein [Niabella sp. CC-SYL272]|uniref:right-handed parallel beta-helix repeat-containing protein n=1 Tax=Niabella agricola TaxID=2891571 RepID=UPI001F374FD9|nr:right-handed parallel beta-helix repeat-containing protein [Niabella agricola]MCF3107518.1 right-handed parallel beta-helix repeat-containing protein [Niabella agricola]
MKKSLRFILILLFALHSGTFFAAPVIHKPTVRINLLDFGAKGDGQFDNYLPLMNALNSASKIKNSVVFIPRGNYLINKQVVVNFDFIIQGEEGATILTGDQVKNNLFYNATPDIAAEINDLQITQNDQSVQISNIATFYKAKIRFTNCTFNIKTPLILRNCKDVTIQNCRFNNTRSPMGAILTIFASSELKLTDNTFNATGGVTFVDSCSFVKIANNRFSEMKNAYPLHFDFKNVTDKRHSYVIIEGNSFVGNAAQAHAGGTYDQISCFGVNFLHIKNNSIKDGGDMGITISRCANVLIDSNTCEQNYSSGISVDNATLCIISANRLLNNGAKSTKSSGIPESKSGLFIVTNGASEIDSLILYNNTISNGVSKIKTNLVSITNKTKASGIFSVNADKTRSIYGTPNQLNLARYNQLKATLLNRIRF